MYICRKCEGLFDAGELRGGICEDCLEAERQQEERKGQADAQAVHQGTAGRAAGINMLKELNRNAGNSV